MTDLDDKAVRLEEYTHSLEDFKIQSEIDRYDHMGALITDAVLQAGIHYDSVVKPRALHVQNLPEANTTSGFLKVLSQQGPETLIKFHGAKVLRILGHRSGDHDAGARKRGWSVRGTTFESVPEMLGARHGKRFF